ncbi:type II toxin-antitoxin system RelE/ParE family toxin [Dinghuibacter silviterrae]|uniref:Plasmid stabilization system protein ParE n=1 Tax=Dinghuibacter silviterrae TaxID=1539049 RepID=A0A4R8DJ62_9BACT|nr:type II toxin-antitoxin system RelE/ParE family toxin [Dinghuibacter silviterrae]TDW97625.1 plasmid stabilization system protein ParE [Dinghuibacter silviterrae]
MVKELRKVVWNEDVRQQLKEIYEYIKAGSPRSANKVRNDIVSLTRKLPSQPESHPPDKYKIDNDGTWRAFEKHHYRIAYRIKEKEIRIIRIRHTKMNPLQY